MDSSFDLRWAAVAAGDLSAFAEFYERHVNRVFSHCVGRLGSVEDAKDLTAEVFLIVLELPARVYYSSESDILPSLLTIANNLMHEQDRRNRRTRKLLAQIPRAVSEPDHAEALVDADADQDAIRRALRALGTLSDSDREIIELCVIQGVSPTTLAGDTTPPATVRTRLFRALTRARSAFDATPTPKSRDERSVRR